MSIFWKAKCWYHLEVGRLYALANKDVNKEKYPGLYVFLYKKWQLHAVKAMRILDKKLQNLIKETA